MNNKGKFVGFGPDLKTPKDLLLKLEYDYTLVQDNPRDTYAAFNFFVTAEQMPDWVSNKPLRNTEPLLKIVSHLATGAKHFDPDTNRHKSVSHLDAPDEAFQANAFQASGFQVGSLVVSLIGDEAKLFGTTISVSELANKVIEYWRNYIGTSTTTSRH